MVESTLHSRGVAELKRRETECHARLAFPVKVQSSNIASSPRASSTLYPSPSSSLRRDEANIARAMMRALLYACAGAYPGPTS